MVAHNGKKKTKERINKTDNNEYPALVCTVKHCLNLRYMLNKLKHIFIL